MSQIKDVISTFNEIKNSSHEIIEDIHFKIFHGQKQSFDKKLKELYENICQRNIFWGFAKDIEEKFQEDFYDKSINSIRLAIILCILVYGSSGILDIWSLPSTRISAWVIRYTTIFFFIIPIFFATYIKKFKKFIQPLTSLVMVAVGSNIIIIAGLAKQHELGFLFYSGGLVLVIMINYTVAQISLRYATYTGWIILFVFEFMAVFKQDMLLDYEKTILLCMMNFVFVAANICGMVGGYFIEFYRRKDFLQRQLMEQEQVISENLLLNILPKEIVAILKNENRIISEYYEGASILFADVVNFTSMSQNMSPGELVQLLNAIFSYFDTLVEKYGVEKIKTIGDCYMVAAGVPTPRHDHALVLAQMALDMNTFVKNNTFSNNIKISFKIGINSGPVVAGVIGKKKFVYDLWGDAVNTASRMESHGSGGKIQITRATYEKIKDQFDCECLGKIAIKGKGEMEVWNIIGRKIDQ
ncbi:MAG: adenylate/guanylate cyclase domain-containing protein [Desulfobacterales bacterium]|nr:adenylate/guanylate cyclase domain-containing protein [Desulfobacterales bacterium]